MNCPFCGIVMPSYQDRGISFAHPSGKCPMAGDLAHVMTWEKLQDAVEHRDRLRTAKRIELPGVAS